VKRTALIGLGYGLTYLPAIERVPELSLVALMSRGSRRSRGVARALGLPYRTSIEELIETDRPKLAIVAVPPDDAEDIVLPLLASGCDVLCEFPIDLELARAAKKKRKTRFDVNAHFSLLPAAMTFVRACRRRVPSIVDVVCHERTLYPCLDTIHRAVGATLVPRAATKTNGGFVIAGTIAKAPATIRVTPLLREIDDGRDVFFGQRISVGFLEKSRGRSITLVDSFGPVLASREVLVDLEVIHPPTRLAHIERDRVAANEAALRGMLRRERDDARTFEVAEAYSAVLDRIASKTGRRDRSNHR